MQTNPPDTAEVTLPAGLWQNGVCLRQARLRPLSGEDEAFLLEEANGLLPAHRTTVLLARCLAGLGPSVQIDEAAVRSLTAGDREALLLHLWRLTFGEHIACTVDCPLAECDETMALDLTVGQLLTPAYENARERYETTLRNNGSTYTVSFRLPTGADQEVAAAIAAIDIQKAEDLILNRCVERVVCDTDRPVDPLPQAVCEHLQAQMEALDPQAELRLDLFCPACGRSFATLFDTGAFLLQEIANRMKYLYREIHLLAFYYHWSEAEILGMTPRKRRRYITLLTEALSDKDSL